MAYASGRYRITYNGEIYNFIELRSELEARGHRFLSDSDTEVILAAFCEWGEHCLDRFNGMWAFAIWDNQERALFLSRDRLGKKPLYYAEVPTGFAFASEMKALCPVLPDVRPNVGLLRAPGRIFRYESTGECLIEGISRFPAGHSGWWKKGRLSTRRWWCTLDHLQDVPLRYEEQVEQFRELFLDACRLRMRSDVPVGTALSGGLDSSATFSAMASLGSPGVGDRITRDWQHAFVASFPGTVLDEKHYAEMVAGFHGVEATCVEIDPLKAIGRLDEDLYLFEDVYITMPLPFMALYAEMRARGVKVTVDGHGADELFAGYPFDFIHALEDAGLDLDSVRMILAAYCDSYPKNSSQFHPPRKLRTWLAFHARGLAGKFLRRPPMPGLDTGDARWRNLDALNRVLYTTTHESVLPTLLRNYDRYSMASGVEIRMPFMDHRIVTFAFSIPWTSKLRNGFSKSIIRDGMARLMPREIAYRKSKIGFNSPIVDWMRGPLRQFFLDTVGSTSFNQCTLIEPRAVRANIMRVLDDNNATFSRGEEAWTQLVPYLWEKAFLAKINAPRRAHKV